MTLAADDFDAFFRAVNGGHGPFGWQRRLLDYVMREGRWPTRISAPTGSGKSNVVDVHVFANALFGVGVAPRVPRRLAVVVNRRAIVDSHHARAQHILRTLQSPEATGVVAATRDGLVALRSSTMWAVGDRPDPVAEPAPLVVAELRGGLPRDRDWLDDPSACAIIAATPDMWGSRLLMRGYGSRPQAWPREAGLLAYDSVVVVDEAHLNRQLVLTANRVVELESVASDGLDVPRLQVVDTTATPSGVDVGDTVGVVAGDLNTEADDTLAGRLTSPKPVTLTASPSWPGKGKVPRPHVDTFVAEAAELLAMRGDDRRPVGCIVNRVDTAIKVTEALRSKGFQAEAWVGRRRPMDIDRLQQDYPGLFAASDDDVGGLDVLVATQTVEVGVDLDLQSLVTELASGSALAQRAGRVNRIGRSDSARIVVVVPGETARIEDYLPYTAEDLTSALAWLGRRAADPYGLSPWAVNDDRPPGQAQRRVLHQRAELYDAWWLAQTSEHLFADVDLALFLRDDLEGETASGGLVVRDFAAAINSPDGETALEPTDAIALLMATPPVARETFDVPFGRLRTLVERALHETPQLVFVARRGEVEVVLDVDELRPGDTVVVSTSLRCFTAGVPVEDGADPVERTCWGEPGVEPASAAIRRDLVGLTAEDAQAMYGNEDRQVVLPPNSESRDELPWVVLLPTEVVKADTETLQVTGLGGGVSLEQHQANVQARARELASRVGLPADIVEALALAGLLHDEGKRDARFQRGLDARDEVLAKSGVRSAQQVKRDWSEAALRTGWRHEQLSAAIAYAGVDASRDLVVRLAGTSHGRGRGVFDHPPYELGAHKIDPDAASAADKLFGADAQWERLVSTTHDRWGVWGCAYLEAILRAADCQISREGS